MTRFCIMLASLLLALVVSGCTASSTVESGFLGGVKVSAANSKLEIEKSGLTTNSSVNILTGEQITVRLHLRDEQNSPFVPTQMASVTFDASGGTASGTFSAVTNRGDGTFVSTFTAVTDGTALSLSAKLNGSDLATNQPEIRIQSAGFSLLTSTTTASAATVTSGSSVTLTLRLRDSSNQPFTTGGQTVSFVQSAGTSTGTFGSVVDHNDGTFTATFTGVTAGTAAQIRAQVNGSLLTSTPASVTVQASSTIASLDWVTAPAVSYTASSSVSMTSFKARLLDLNGNLIASDNTTQVSLSLQTGAGTLSGTTTRTVSGGIATFTDIRYTKAESIVIRATESASGSSRYVDSSSIAVSPGVADPAESLLAVSPTSVLPGVASTITLTAKDSYSNPIPSLSVTLSASGGTGNSLTQPSSQTSAAGVTTGSFSSSSAGSKTISVTSPAVLNTMSVALTVNAVTLSVAAPTGIISKGETATFTVTLSNPLATDVTFDYATSNGTATAGTHYTAASGSRTIAAGATTATFGVATLDDGTSDSTDRTFTATLSNPSGASLDTATATGTIHDAKYSWDFTAGTLPTGLTLTRSGTNATYYDSTGKLVTAAANAPRFDHDPSSLVSKGLLIEPGATNLLRYSEALNTAANWTVSAGPELTIGINSTESVAPDGAQTAELLQEANDGGVAKTHSLSQNATVSAGRFAAASIFAKLPATNARRYLQISIRNGSNPTTAVGLNVIYDLTGGTSPVSFISNGTSDSRLYADGIWMRPLTNGWYRLSFVGIVDLTSTAYTISYTLRDTNTASVASEAYAGDGLKAVLLWGAQFESHPGQATASSYIATTSTSGARSGDVLTNPTDSAFGANQWTVIYDYSSDGWNPAASSSQSFPLCLGSASNFLIRWVPNKLIAVNNQGNSGSGFTVGTRSLGQTYKTAIIKKPTSLQMFIDNTAYSAFTVTTATTGNSLYFGAAGTSMSMSITVRKFTFRSRALSATAAQAATQ